MEVPRHAGLNDFGTYRKALDLFDFVVRDVNRWLKRLECWRLASQQIASADSIASNIEEGYGRQSRKEYVQFLVISRGSAQETAGRYKRLRHRIPEETVRKRVVLADEVIGILTSTIRTLRTR